MHNCCVGRYHTLSRNLYLLPTVRPPILFSCVDGRLIDVGACFYHEYVGEVRLMEMGKLGARGTKRSAERDFRFRGW